MKFYNIGGIIINNHFELSEKVLTNIKLKVKSLKKEIGVAFAIRLIPKEILVKSIPCFFIFNLKQE